MYPMTTHLAEHFGKRRRERELKLVQVARMVGYSNVAKGIRRIEAFERTGRITPDLLAKLATALEIDRPTVNLLFHEDYREWLHRINKPIRPYLVRRMLFSGGPLAVPSGIMSIEAMEEYAAALAERWQMDVCLVMSHRIQIWFSSDGSIREVVEQVPDILQGNMT